MDTPTFFKNIEAAFTDIYENISKELTFFTDKSPIFH